MIFSTTPKPFQLEAWNRSKHLKYFALLMDMGLGKTKVCIDTINYQYSKGWIDSALIYGNIGSYTNWEDEFKLHFPESIPYVLAVWTSQHKKADRERINELFKGENRDKLKIFIMNIEALGKGKGKSRDLLKRKNSLAPVLAMRFMLENKAPFLVVDESTTIKNPTAKRTKDLWKLSAVAKSVRIMTGSLIDNSPMNAYSQFHALKPGLLGHTSFLTFKTQFAQLEKGYGKNRRPYFKILGYQNLPVLKERISKHSFIVKKSDVLKDLPPKVYMRPFQVKLSDEQRKHYNDYKRKAYTYCNFNLSSAKLAVTKLLRLHQICFGFLTDDDGTVHKLKHHRIEALLQVIEETSDEKIVIWCGCVPAIEEIVTSLRNEYGYNEVLTYYGATLKEEREEVKQVFKRGYKGGARILVSNQTVGGYGNTWTAATLMLYYGNSFDAEVRNQSEDRAHRIGQINSVSYMDFICPGTVEEKIIETIRNKQSISEETIVTNWKELLS